MGINEQYISNTVARLSSLAVPISCDTSAPKLRCHHSNTTILTQPRNSLPRLTSLVKSVNPRSSTIISNSTGRSTTLDNSKPSCHSARPSARPTDLLTPNDSSPSNPTPGALLRGWGDSSKPIFNRNSTTRRSSGGGRVSIREPTIVEDAPEEEIGGLLRGWGDISAPTFPIDKGGRESRELDSSYVRR